MPNPTPEALVALVAVATGKIVHVYNGECPDEIEGHDRRDPACPACQAIEAALASREPAAQPKAAPGAVEEAARLLQAWIDEGECECEGSSHRCGRPNVERTIADLRALASQPVAVDLEQFRRAVEVYRGCYDYDRDGRKYKLAEREAEADRLLALIDSAGAEGKG